MAGTFTANRVEGQLPNAKGTLYTCATINALIKTITLVNDSAGAVTVNLYFKDATSRRILSKDYSIVAGGQVMIEFNGILLVGDFIEGDASSATTVDYWISLVEET